MEARLFSVVHGRRMTDNCHKLKREKFRLARRNFHCKGSQAVAKVAQRGCRVSALGVFKTQVEIAPSNLV